jgi:hypothetical protein
MLAAVSTPTMVGAPLMLTTPPPPDESPVVDDRGSFVPQVSIYFPSLFFGIVS